MELNKDKCLIEACNNYPVTRGVCMSCRVSLSKAKKNKEVSQDELDRILLPRKKKRRKSKTMSWILNQFKDSAISSNPVIGAQILPSKGTDEEASSLDQLEKIGLGRENDNDIEDKQIKFSFGDIASSQPIISNQNALSEERKNI